jgi:uncharacterized repeat protein (TIGR03803 family)
MTFRVQLAFAALACLLMALSKPARAQSLTETVIYSFQPGAGGWDPVVSGVIKDAEGNLYGTAYYGGAFDSGTVFKIDPSGSETTLYNFTGKTDGSGPWGGLVMDKSGHMFGMTAYGGIFNDDICYYGCGVVYEIDEAGNFRTLHLFKGGDDGALPEASLTLDNDGDLYGTTYGSLNYGGTVFKIDRNGVETVIHAFEGSDGWKPEAGVTLGLDGNLYGTTFSGGADNCGAVFKIDREYHESVVYSFVRNNSDGCNPLAPVLWTPRALYGTTFEGGSPFGGGTVFEVNLCSGQETILHAFTTTESYFPNSPLLRDSQGNLYGTTISGGLAYRGTLFKVGAQRGFSLLFQYPSGPLGIGAAGPTGPLLLDGQDRIYGTAGGGTADAGTVYELSREQ